MVRWASSTLVAFRSMSLWWLTLNQNLSLQEPFGKVIAINAPLQDGVGVGGFKCSRINRWQCASSITNGSAGC